MPAEREFVQERFNIVKQILADKNKQRTRQEQIALEREHRLLGKILFEVEEGKVLSALTTWQKNLSMIDKSFAEMAQYLILAIS